MNEQNDVRAAYRPDLTPLTESQAQRSTGMCHLFYRGAGTVIIAGTCFRRVYVFSPKEPEQWVEAEDVGALMSTGHFVIRR